MKKEISRNNHYLSQMYLDAWKNDNNEVLVYELLVPNEKCPIWKSKSTKSVGSYDSMFVRLKNGIEVDDIEEWFRDRYETPAKKSLEHAINDERITIDEWHCLIDFVACHIVRSPAYIIKILDLAKKDCIPIFEEKCEDISNFSEKEILNTIAENKTDKLNELFPIKITGIGSDNKNNEIFKIETIFGKQFYIWIMIHLLQNTSKILHSHKWGIITVDKNVILPTSDDPVICLNYNSESDYNFDGGWGKENSNILFPISPNKILYTQVGIKVKPRINVGYKTSLLFKKMIIEHSYRKVISNFVDKDVVRIKQRYVSEGEYKKEKKMWEDFQKNYLEKERDYIR